MSAKGNMEPLELLAALARAADAAPRLSADVAPRVLRRIRALHGRAERPLLWVALGAAGAAAVAAASALPAWLSWTDPLSQVILLAGGVAP